MKVRGQLHVQVVYTRGKIPQVSAKAEWASGVVSELWRTEKNLLFLPGIKPRFVGRPTCSLVAMLTGLSRLHDCSYVIVNV
jgi:hypothetical protein